MLRVNHETQYCWLSTEKTTRTCLKNDIYVAAALSLDSALFIISCKQRRPNHPCLASTQNYHFETGSRSVDYSTTVTFSACRPF